MTTNQNCTRCLLSTEDDPLMEFNDRGECKYCQYYDRVVEQLGNEEQREKYIHNKVEQIKRDGRNKPYDCILGVSGGVDSSYLAYWAKEQGLRPLVAHFDNGWDSELAVENINSICRKLNFSLQTIVINWEEFKQLQLAFLRAGVVDIEALTDHAIFATIYEIAKKNNLRYTINGFNYSTEAIMPKGWVFDKTDFANIKDINSKFGTAPIKTFPHRTFLTQFVDSYFYKMEAIKVLNYINYNKEEAKDTLKKQLGWKDYGGKHYESVFTKFYQAYILPRKFGIDKRKAHLSSLICSGQLTREQAYEKLKEPLYNEAEMEQEINYILKKWEISKEEFEKIMSEKPRNHNEFRTQKKYWDLYFKMIGFLRPWKK